MWRKYAALGTVYEWQLRTNGRPYHGSKTVLWTCEWSVPAHAIRRKRGRPKQIWMDSVKRNIRATGTTKGEVHDKTGWRRIVSAAATHNQVGAARRRRRRIGSRIVVHHSISSPAGSAWLRNSPDDNRWKVTSARRLRAVYISPAGTTADVLCLPPDWRRSLAGRHGHAAIWSSDCEVILPPHVRASVAQRKYYHRLCESNIIII